jgi:hypothetical protein
MFKTFSYIFIILFSSFTYAQKNEDDFQMPIYPGCEKAKNNEERLTCLQKNITSLYTEHLQNYVNSFEYLNIAKANAKILLELDAEGNLLLKDVQTDLPIFRGYNVLAFKNFKEELIKDKVKIVPAKRVANGENVRLRISFPVEFKLNKLVTETDTRLISVLHDENTTYKIYLAPNLDLKVYEENDSKLTYLGKYNSLQELKNTMPYQVIIQDSSELVTLVQSDFGKVKMLLQTLNIFDEDNFYTLFIISEVKGKKIKQLRKFTSFADFQNSPYYDWLKLKI